MNHYRSIYEASCASAWQCVLDRCDGEKNGNRFHWLGTSSERTHTLNGCFERAFGSRKQPAKPFTVFHSLWFAIIVYIRFSSESSYGLGVPALVVVAVVVIDDVDLTCCKNLKRCNLMSLYKCFQFAALRSFAFDVLISFVNFSVYVHCCRLCVCVCLGCRLCDCFIFVFVYFYSVPIDTINWMVLPQDSS